MCKTSHFLTTFLRQVSILFNLITNKNFPKPIYVLKTEISNPTKKTFNWIIKQKPTIANKTIFTIWVKCENKIISSQKAFI